MLGQPNPYRLNEEFNADMSPRPGTYLEYQNTNYHRNILKNFQIRYQFHETYNLAITSCY